MPYYDMNAIMEKLNSIDSRLEKIEPKQSPHEYQKLGGADFPEAIFCAHCGDIRRVKDSKVI